MKILSINETEDTPHVILDKEHGIFEISGRSPPEDSVSFYKPIIEWIDDYKKEANATTDFFFKLEYSNTASSKLIMDVLTALKGIAGIKAVWYYHDDDEDTEELGRELSEQVDVPFEFRTY